MQIKCVSVTCIACKLKSDEVSFSVSLNFVCCHLLNNARVELEEVTSPASVQSVAMTTAFPRNWATLTLLPRVVFHVRGLKRPR